jgi:hypothetical protein
VNQVRVLRRPQQGLRGIQRLAEVQCPDQVRLFQVGDRGLDVLARRGLRLLGIGADLRAGGQDSEGVVVLGVIEQGPDHFNLGTRQQRIAVARGLEEEHPVASLPFHLCRQHRPVAYHQVLRTLVFRGGEAGEAALFRGRIVDAQGQILVGPRQPLAGVEEQVVAFLDGFELVRITAPAQASPVLDQAVERPVADQVQVVACREALVEGKTRILKVLPSTHSSKAGSRRV